MKKKLLLLLSYCIGASQIAFGSESTPATHAYKTRLSSDRTKRRDYADDNRKNLYRQTKKAKQVSDNGTSASSQPLAQPSASNKRKVSATTHTAEATAKKQKTEQTIHSLQPQQCTPAQLLANAHYWENRNYTKTVLYFNELQTKHTNSDEAACARAWLVPILLKKESYEKAYKLFRNILEKNFDPNGYVHLFNSLNNMLETAQPSLKTVWARTLLATMYQYNRGASRDAAKRKQLLQKASQELASLAPEKTANVYLPHNADIDLSDLARDPHEKLASINKAIHPKQCPFTLATALEKRGDCLQFDSVGSTPHEWLKNHKQALTDYLRALVSYTHKNDSLHLLTLAEPELEKHAHAIIKDAQVNARSAKEYALITHIGALYKKLGYKNNIAVDCQKVARLQTQYIEAWYAHIRQHDYPYYFDTQDASEFIYESEEALKKSANESHEEEWIQRIKIRRDAKKIIERDMVHGRRVQEHYDHIEDNFPRPVDPDYEELIGTGSCDERQITATPALDPDLRKARDTAHALFVQRNPTFFKN